MGESNISYSGEFAKPVEHQELRFNLTVFLLELQEVSGVPNDVYIIHHHSTSLRNASAWDEALTALEGKRSVGSCSAMSVMSRPKRGLVRVEHHACGLRSPKPIKKIFAKEPFVSGIQTANTSSTCL